MQEKRPKSTTPSSTAVRRNAHGLLLLPAPPVLHGLLLLLGRADREVDLALNAQGRQRGLGLLLPCRNSLALVKNLLAKQLQLFGRPLAAVRDMAHRADYQRTDEVCGDK